MFNEGSVGISMVEIRKSFKEELAFNMGKTQGEGKGTPGEGNSIGKHVKMKSMEGFYEN